LGRIRPSRARVLTRGRAWACALAAIAQRRPEIEGRCHLRPVAARLLRRRKDVCDPGRGRGVRCVRLRPLRNRRTTRTHRRSGRRTHRARRKSDERACSCNRREHQPRTHSDPLSRAWWVRAYDGTKGLRKVPRSHPKTMKVLRSLGTRALPNAYVPTRSVTVHLTVPVKRSPVERTTPGPESRKPSFAERSLTVMTYVPDGTVSSGPSAIFDCREIEAESLRGGCTVTEPTVNTPLIVSAWGSQT